MASRVSSGRSGGGGKHSAHGDMERFKLNECKHDHLEAPATVTVLYNSEVCSLSLKELSEKEIKRIDEAQSILHTFRNVFSSSRSPKGWWTFILNTSRDTVTTKLNDCNKEREFTRD